jgi:hypothetical protein
MVVKEPQEVFSGGCHAHFADPNGYYWEVAWGPDFRFDEDGMLVLQTLRLCGVNDPLNV